MVKKEKNAYGLFVPACLLIGIGVGFIVNYVAAGCLIGLGTGFLLMAFGNILKKK